MELPWQIVGRPSNDTRSTVIFDVSVRFKIFQNEITHQRKVVSHYVSPPHDSPYTGLSKAVIESRGAALENSEEA